MQSEIYGTETIIHSIRWPRSGRRRPGLLGVLGALGILLTLASTPVGATPVCTIQLNQASFVTGDQVIASVLQVANFTASPVDIEFKFWFDVPGSPPISFARGGDDSSVRLSAGFNKNLGPLLLFQVPAAIPRGTYGFNCRFVDPVTGAFQTESLQAFTIH